MRARLVLLAMSLAIAVVARASAAPAPPAEAKALEPLKKLAGTWQGNAKMGDKTMAVTIVYELTAGGSAVLERLFPGTPHEMISVYTSDGDGVAMTHYCALGNHPKMTL